MVFNNPYKVLFVGKYKDAKTVTIGGTDYRFYKSQVRFFPYDTDLDAIKADIDFVVDEMSWSEIADAINESGFKGNTNRTFSQLITPAILVAGFDKTELSAYLGGGASVDTYLAEFDLEDIITFVEGEGYTVTET
jgi:hypothetical protein